MRVRGGGTDGGGRGNARLYWDGYDPAPGNRFETTTGAIRDAYPPTAGYTADRVEVRPRSGELAVDEHSATPPARIDICGTGAPQDAGTDRQAQLRVW